MVDYQFIGMGDGEQNALVIDQRNGAENVDGKGFHWAY